VGKTRVLQEIEYFLSQPRVDSQSLFALQEIGVERTLDGEHLGEWLRQHRPLAKDQPTGIETVLSFPNGNLQQLQLQTIQGNWDGLGGRPFLGPLSNHLISTLYCGNRLSTNFSAQRPDAPGRLNHPLHFLMNDERLTREFREAFAKAFQMNLIIDGFGNTINLRISRHLTQDDFVSTTNTGIFDPELSERLSAALPIQVQSDGVRSFAGILFTLLTRQFPLLLIDEPEAFLHPPQARLLGQYLARWNRRGQIFVSTHSLDVLLGLIEGDPSNVLIVRLTREGSSTSPHMLPPASLAEISENPLFHYSRALDGLFHHAVVLCEAERDCTFYSAALECALERQERGFTPGDVLFVPTGGKDGFPEMAKALKAVSIPVVVIPDMDIMNDRGKLRTLIDAMGGDWSSFESSYNVATEAFRQPRQPVLNGQILRAVSEVLSPISDKIFDNQTKEEVRVAMRINPSPWEELKRYGIDAFRNQARQEADKIISRLGELGIVVVERGELESLAPSVRSRKGKNWLAEALEERAYRDEPAQKQISRVIQTVERLLGQLEPEKQASE
jgi:hypothetical protein